MNGNSKYGEAILADASIVEETHYGRNVLIGVGVAALAVAAAAAASHFGLLPHFGGPITLPDLRVEPGMGSLGQDAITHLGSVAVKA